MSQTIQAEIVVIGAGPGGYGAAFYAADRGKKVVLIDAQKRLGGVCLNTGCIPSKAFLHAAALIQETKAAGARGLHFGAPRIELEQMRAWKESVLNKLAQGIVNLSKRRGVEVLNGKARFENAKCLSVAGEEGACRVEFETAIIATGSYPALPKMFDLDSSRIMTSGEALELEDIPEKLLVIGGGYIGMELGTVYAAFGSQITMVEALEDILSGTDPDLLRPVKDFAEKNFKALKVGAKVTAVKRTGEQIEAEIQQNEEVSRETFDRVLVSVGRLANTRELGLENIPVKTDSKGFIEVNENQQTSQTNVYAIGDVSGGILLAHQAHAEARKAVDAILGDSSRQPSCVVPFVVFTDPEIAWCGLSETQAKAEGRAVEIVKFPWLASGRAMTLERPDGLTKLIIEPETEKILGMGITGYGAGELIGEGVLAIETGATARDLARSIHPHPTLSETLSEAADLFFGYATNAMFRKRTLK